MTKREDYITGKLFHVGDIVISKTDRTLHEVFSLGTNYLTVCSSNGVISKIWIENAVVANALREDFDDLVPYPENGQLSYYGYVTESFNEELVREFVSLLREEHDKIAMMKLIRETDKLMYAINNTYKTNIEKLRELSENTLKYLNNLKGNK